MSNDKTGAFTIRDSVLTNNRKGTFETAAYPGIFVIARPGNPVVTGSTIESPAGYSYADQLAGPASRRMTSAAWT